MSALWRMGLFIALTGIIASGLSCSPKPPSDLSQIPQKDCQRVISLSPAVTELICALERQERLVGRSSACNYPASVLDLPIAGDFGKADLETIIKLQPEWVISNALLKNETAILLQQAGIVVTVVPVENPDDLPPLLKLLGEKLDATNKAEELVLKYQTELSALSHSGSVYSPRVLWVVWDQPLMIAGEDSLPGKALKLAGCEVIAPEQGNKNGYFQPSMEWLYLQNPEWIIFPSVDGEQRKAFLDTELWSKLTAVQTGQIITSLDEDQILRPSLRWPGAVKELQKLIFTSKVNSPTSE